MKKARDDGERKPPGAQDGFRTDDMPAIAPAKPERAGLLVLSSPDLARVGTTLLLEHTLTIGRQTDDANAVTTVQDNRISRQHVRVANEGGSFIVEDIGSRNGTFVDGRRVNKQALRLGEILRVGDTLMELVRDATAPIAPLISGELMTASPELLRLLQQLDRIAPSNIPTLLLGESGTGKELLARRLHERSERRGAFVTINCGAIPETLVESHLFGHVRGAFTGANQTTTGYFARAEGGTLFLDEAGELPPLTQVKLLRVLENGEYARVGADHVERCDVRIVAATNASVDGFRQDLYARLAGFVLRLPPLRARKRDIVLLARSFLAQEAPGFVLSVDFIEALLTHDWRMNVRELKQAMKRVAVLAGDERLLDLKLLEGLLEPEREAERPNDEAGRHPVEAPSKASLISLLSKHSGNVARVAQSLNKNSRQIYRWLEKFALDPNDYRAKKDEP